MLKDNGSIVTYILHVSAFWEKLSNLRTWYCLF